MVVPSGIFVKSPLQAEYTNTPHSPEVVLVDAEVTRLITPVGAMMNCGVVMATEFVLSGFVFTWLCMASCEGHKVNHLQSSMAMGRTCTNATNSSVE